MQGNNRRPIYSADPSEIQDNSVNGWALLEEVTDVRRKLHDRSEEQEPLQGNDCNFMPMLIQKIGLKRAAVNRTADATKVCRVSYH